MKLRKFRSWVAAAVSAGAVVPPAALAAPAGQPFIADVALAEGGVLSGQVLSAEGAAMPQAPVAILSAGREVVRVASADDGTFAVSGLKGGVYEVATPGQHGVYRLWSPQTAPPTAGNGVMLVSQSEIVRGQYGFAPPPPPGGDTPMASAPAPGPGPFGKAMGWMGQHPFITAGVVATAIAVPIAVSELDDAS
jgi:hypothetical protein